MIRGETHPYAVNYSGGMGGAEGLGTDLSALGHRKKSCNLKVQLEYKGMSLRALPNGGRAAGTLSRVGGDDKCRQVQGLGSPGNWLT